MATICSHYFSQCVQGALRQGKDVPALFREAGVDIGILEHPTARADIEGMARLVRGIWAALDDEFMGFTAHRAKVGLFRLMAESVIAAESLEEALLTGTRFYNVVRDDVRTTLRIDGTQAWIEAEFARPDLDPAHYFLEFWLIIWHRLASWLTGGPVALTRAAFTFERPDSYMEEFKYLFPCRHAFNTTANGFAFDIRHLRLPLVRTRAELQGLLAEAPLDFMTMPAADTSVARRIRTLLLPRHGQPVDFPTADALAAQIHMTPPTLRRRLRDESTSYRQIKENIRRDIATKKVLLGKTAIEDIAALVGYSETRAFTRAFHQWTGLSPLQYRQKFYRPLAA